MKYPGPLLVYPPAAVECSNALATPPQAMPYLNIQTNITLDPEQQSTLLTAASAAVAAALGKPESYVMVALQCEVAMLFAGSDQPLAYLELKSLGLPRQRTAELSETLCGLLEASVAIPTARIYIEFADPERSMWGWNGGTF